MTRAALPTRVILMAEYGDLLPLWDRSPSPDRLSGPFERGSLGLPDELETRLEQWNERFERLMGSRFEWPSRAEHLDFVVDGHLLAARLQEAFGSRVVVLYPEADGGTPRSSADRASAAEQSFRAMSDAEFDERTRDLDSSRFVWEPGRMPTRILLEPGSELPLRDRSPLVDMADDRLTAAMLGLSDRLQARLQDWSDRWASVPSTPAADAGLPVRYLIEGHELAAEVQRELGPDVAILFPEADRSHSTPSPELQLLVERLRARGR